MDIVYKILDRIRIACIFTMISIILNFVWLVYVEFSRIYDNTVFQLKREKTLSENLRPEVILNNAQKEINLWNAEVQGYNAFIETYQNSLQSQILENYGDKADFEYCTNYRKLRKIEPYEKRAKFDYNRCVKLDINRYENGYLPTQIELITSKNLLNNQEDSQYFIFFFAELIRLGSLENLQNKTVEEQGILKGRVNALADITNNTVKTNLSPKPNININSTVKTESAHPQSNVSIDDIKKRAFFKTKQRFLNRFNNIIHGGKDLLLDMLLWMSAIAFIVAFAIGPAALNRPTVHKRPLIKRLILMLVIFFSPLLIFFIINPIIGVTILIVLVIALIYSLIID